MSFNNLVLELLLTCVVPVMLVLVLEFSFVDSHALVVQVLKSHFNAFALRHLGVSIGRVVAMDLSLTFLVDAFRHLVDLLIIT